MNTNVTLTRDAEDPVGTQVKILDDANGNAEVDTLTRPTQNDGVAYFRLRSNVGGKGSKQKFTVDVRNDDNARQTAWVFAVNVD